MATMLLSAAGSAVGGAIGGTLAGLSSTVIGRAIGATLGRAIDQRLLGGGSDPVETGKTDRFRLTGAAEGAPITQVFGRMRVGGQVIWATDFLETSEVSGGGKGQPSAPQTVTYGYSVSLAIAICEGAILSVPRVWADGEEIGRETLNMRVYPGDAAQLPDPKIEAVEGAGMAPAYRGTAYVVIEDLDLGRFGNRVPQFSFEVVRAAQADPGDVNTAVRGAALIPGTGEYALAPDAVYFSSGPGSSWAANLNTPSGQSDYLTSMSALREELPNCDAVSLIVSWFGDDLRCGSCSLRPKVEQTEFDGTQMPWSVSGLTRGAADVIAQADGRPIYGGTPADASVVAAIREMNEAGQKVMFYPFVLMDQQAGNGLPDPWSDAADQPVLPWRGRITLSQAPGRAGSPDGTAQADAQIAQFFGTASASDFSVGDGTVGYSGPAEWSMRRFILHYAAICAAAGGVEAFCIGSEMRALTQLRGADGFAAVAQLRALTGEVRALLGPQVKLGYAADWTEYWGHQPLDESGDRYFHLDPLWADAEIDFVGIDNYMPMSDWRDGDAHLDAGWGDVHNLDYLKANIEGGEGYDWFYHSPEALQAQIRTPISDGAHDEPWIYRNKDIRNWWGNAHHERIGGVRQAQPTAWVPQSKPIWFTEYGCAAVDKGTNQPNRFVDPKSSESGLPRFSNGARDDLLQRHYVRALNDYWGSEGRNPVSAEYGGAMIDMSRAFVWAWDARPFPYFPNNRTLWSDGANYASGHWLNGRTGTRTLASVVAEICARSGVEGVDVSDLYGIVRGYAIDAVSDARAALQPLMLRHGFDAVERNGVLSFRMRGRGVPVRLDAAGMVAVEDDDTGPVTFTRAAEADLAGRVRLRFSEADGDHDVLAEEAILPDDATHAVAASELAMALTRGEGRQVVERWLPEARIARDSASFALPLSFVGLGAGDLVELPGPEGAGEAIYRIDSVEQTDRQTIEATRTDPALYVAAEMVEDVPTVRAFVPPVPVLPLFLDLPLISGDEVPQAPHLAVSAQPWPGSVAVYRSGSDDDYALDRIIAQRSVIGTTQNQLLSAPSCLWDRGAPLEIKLLSGALQSKSRDSILNGANLAAIGDGSAGGWELFQFETAELVGPETYWVSNRLRGLLGSDAAVPPVWPAGSLVVLMNGVPEQIELASVRRRIAQYFRIGPAQRALNDPSYVQKVEAFDGIGLRPYAPAHLRATREPGGAVAVRWIRRTRIEGDPWENAEVPLGEDTEQYLVRVIGSGGVLREVTVSAPNWTYSTGAQAEDGAVQSVAVAQVSARFGPGLFVSAQVPA